MKHTEEGPAGISENGTRQEFWLSESVKLVQTGDYSGSVHKIDKAIAAAPKKPEAWLLKGYAIYQLGRFDEAVQLFDHVLKLDPGCTKALLLRGLSYIALHRYEEAIRSCDQALAMYPDNSEGWYIRGLALSRLGLYEASIQCYNQAVLLSPGYSDAMYGKKQAEKNFLRQKETLNEVYRAVEQDPENITLLNRMGKILATLGRFNESLEVYSRSLEIDPGNRDTVRGFDSTEKNSRRWADLVPERGRNEKITPNQAPGTPENQHIETFSDQVCSERMGNPAEISPINPVSVPRHIAEQPEEETICPSPVQVPEIMALQAPEISIGIAMDLSGNGEYQDAIEMLMEIVIRCPGDVEPVIALAQAYENAGMFSDALSAYDRAIQIEPENALLWGGRGKMLMKTGRYESADAAYSTALGINSEDAGILAERGDLFRKLGQYPDAEQSYRRSLELQPDAARVWYHRGKTLAMLKRYQEAIDACEIAISLDQSYIEAMMYKGFLLSKIQRYHDALDVFNTVLRIDPQCRDAMRIRQSLKGKV
ncbi:MAG: tetratricopeptide repeat protein [Methanomicrobiales archaeon]